MDGAETKVVSVKINGFGIFSAVSTKQEEARQNRQFLILRERKIV